MNFDFAAFLVLAVAVTGLVWLLDIFFWAPKRHIRLETLKSEMAEGKLEDEKINKIIKEPVWVETSRSIFPVLLAVLVLRSFLVEPFRIPSGSMMPTLLVGDFILVNKFVYGIRLPVINKKVVEIGQPKRGDVVVFKYPNDPAIDYIKRVIGLPGDRIGYYGKNVYVNGVQVAPEMVGVYQGVGSGIAMSGAQLLEENLGDVRHQILIDTTKASLEGEFAVPEGHYFVMGDNRDNSNDSRYWGMVPERNLVGRAFMIWMNWDSANGGVSWRRIGNSIK